MTQLRFLDVPIGDTGLILLLLSNGRLCIERSPLFVPLYDHSTDGITGMFDNDGFGLNEQGKEVQSYDYGIAYPYKTMPVLKQWLVQQNLELPEGV